MFKEIKNLIFVLVILAFIFFTGRYYFSDENIKKSHRSYNNIDKKINAFSKSLPLLENNTIDIIEYSNPTNPKKKKKFNFWKLVEND
jgi:hypothetical protein